jgi:SAM-dependent methyltransferase
MPIYICRICSGELELIYTPKYSIISLEVVICCVCGFVQTTKNVVSQGVSDFVTDSEITALSCDADYSAIRVGKQQMTDHDLELIEGTAIGDLSDMRFLDMSSARGHFALWASRVSTKVVVCIEPDSYLTESYRNALNLTVYEKDYREIEYLPTFDFIYSCHTLEHYADPVKYLQFVSDHLNPNGFFYVNVPNLDGILETVSLDDFFYDKHRVYFDASTLKNLLSCFGFEIVNDWSDNACLRLLLRKCHEFPKRPLSSKYQENRNLVIRYSEVLRKNRESLPQIVDTLHEQISQSSEVVLVGCGRMLDAMIKYGGFSLEKISYLVDNFLGLATSSLYNRPLYRFDNLADFDQDPTFVVMARTSNTDLKKLLNRLHPGAKIIFVSDFFRPK